MLPKLLAHCHPYFTPATKRQPNQSIQTKSRFTPTICYQLEEIKIFTAKIDKLIAQNYNPKLDDGVGKNIAPLQKKGFLRAEVLKAKQLTKYLNADW